MHLSKSDYLLYLKHPAWLWLKKHDPDKLPEVDANLQAIFDAGFNVEAYAEKRFENAVKVGFDGYDEYKTLPARTQTALKEGAEIILQGGFVSDNLVCICDVLAKTGPSSFNLYEVKSSTRTKHEHIDDLAFQTIVLESAGYKVENVAVIHINRDYVRKGEIDPFKLTTQSDVTAQVRGHISRTKTQIAKAWEVVKAKDCPDISPKHASISAFKEWIGIYRQLAPGLDDYSIYDLFRLNGHTLAKLEAEDIKHLADIPENFNLLPQQLLQVKVTKAGKRHIDSAKVAEFMAQLKYPLYFLDYETLGSVIPPFDGMRPYEQLPFQYSLDVINEPGGEPQHFEYLHTERRDPSTDIAKSLAAHIGPSGSILVWYQDFEKACNRLLADKVPEQAEFLSGLNKRVVDLIVPFQKGWVADKGFLGASSIKNVLPVLAPDMSYQELDIQEGQSAQRLWMQAVLDNDEGIDRDELFNNLIQYCALDTMAMVKIYQYLLTELPEAPATQASLL
jgi:hypothetical protein